MKRFISALLAIVLVAQVFCFSASAVNSDTPKHIPRIVSVVFDDSGSMYKDTDRWAYTSYAMQAFSAMMGEEDVLYITYLNAASESVRLNISKSGKQATIDKIENTMFGGGTPNKLQKGADCLTREYGTHKTNAKYYLVVMADGALDDEKTTMKNELGKVTNGTKKALSGADFESVYFSMTNDSLSVDGVTCKSASSGNEIVNVLRDISADIMGRTKLNCSGSGGKISFDLKYPALSIAVFVQKTGSEFKNVKVPITQNGKSVSYETNTYYLNCPTKINKNQNKPIYNEKIPANPPTGFVSLITNGNNSVPKGSYSLDLSSYGITNQNVVILVEPAVRVDCKYFLNGSTEPIAFEQLKKKAQVGDKIIVDCGLYEINSDGSSGAPVPLDVLSPEYKLYINGAPAGKKLNGKNSYEIILEKNHENKELKIEAVLKGYQPFVLRENFEGIRTAPSAVIPDNDQRNIVTLTKPEWKNWLEGKGKISFPLSFVDSSTLNDLSVKVNGADFLPSGKCSSLSNISIAGNTVVYTPTPSKQLKFSQVPAKFTVSLYDDFNNKLISTITVNSIQPKYNVDIVNELEGISLGLEMLKTNSKGVKFVLGADYNNSGTFTPVKNSNCETDIKFTVAQGALTGTTKEENGEFYFVPLYNSEVNTEVSPADIVGKTHTISVSAAVDGVEAANAKIDLAVGNASYKINVENNIAEPFTLDTIKNNKNKIVFTVLADYVGDGNFGPVADWDNSIFDKLTVNSGDLPGTTKKELDKAGKPIGVSFTPVYDENNNNGVVFTKVSGKTHKITGALEPFNVVAETTVEVLAPKYDIKVKKEGLKLVDATIWKNNDGVEFIVLRNDRPLTKEELEGFAPYQLSYTVEQDWLSIEGQAKDGYLFCKPTYDGWTFISPRIWFGLCLLKIHKGDMAIRLTVGENSADAAIHISMSLPSLIILLVILAILLLTAWILFCYLSQKKFSRGTFYKVMLRLQPNQLGYTFSSISKTSATKGAFKKFIFSKNLLIPFGVQTKKISLNSKSALFEAKKASGVSRTFPYSASKNRTDFNRGHLSLTGIEKIVLRNRDFSIDKASLSGSSCGENHFKMDRGIFLVERTANANVIVFYLSKKEERRIKAKKAKHKKIQGSKNNVPAKATTSKSTKKSKGKFKV